MGHPPIRVCIVSDLFPPVYSGAGQQAFEIGRHLAQQGHQVMVLTSLSSSRHQDECVDGIIVRHVARLLPDRVGLLRYSARMALELLLQRKNYDVVHFFSGARTIYLPLMMLTALRKPSIVTASMLGDDDLKSIGEAKLGALRLRLLAHRSVYVSTSPAITERCGLIANPPTYVEIPYGVDTERFKPVSPDKRVELRSLFSIPDSSFVVTFVGKVGMRKGADLVIQAWERVVQDISDARLLFIGPRRLAGSGTEDKDKKFSDLLDAYIRNAGIQKHVRFLETRDVHRYLQASDLFVLPSTQEGLPNAVLEAMACALPVVVCNADWVWSGLIEDDVSGLVIERRDPALLSNIILRLASSPELRLKLGREGRARVLKTYSISARAREYAPLYRERLVENGCNL